jgi:hypothetical protein
VGQQAERALEDLRRDQAGGQSLLDLQADQHRLPDGPGLDGRDARGELIAGVVGVSQLLELTLAAAAVALQRIRGAQQIPLVHETGVTARPGDWPRCAVEECGMGIGVRVKSRVLEPAALRLLQWRGDPVARLLLPATKADPYPLYAQVRHRGLVRSPLGPFAAGTT